MVRPFRLETAHGDKMASSKATVIEELSKVKNLGETYATAAYDDLGIRSVAELIAAARDGKLQTIKGIGPAKEQSILKAAEALSAAPSPAPEASKPKSPTKKDAPKKDAKKPDAPKKADAPKKEAFKKADAPKKEAPKKADAAKQDAPKKEAPKKADAPKNDAPKSEAKKPADKPASDTLRDGTSAKGNKPRTTYRPPQPKARPTLPGLVFKLAKKIIGRLLS